MSNPELQHPAPMYRPVMKRFCSESKENKKLLDKLLESEKSSSFLKGCIVGGCVVYFFCVPGSNNTKVAKIDISTDNGATETINSK